MIRENRIYSILNLCVKWGKMVFETYVIGGEG